MNKKSLPVGNDGTLLINSHPGTLVIEHQRVEISTTFEGPITLLSGMLIINGFVDGDIDVDGGRLIVLGTVTGRVTNGSGSVEVSGKVGDLRGPPAYTRVLPGSIVGAHTVGSEPGAVDTWAEMLSRAAADDAAAIETGDQTNDVVDDRSHADVGDLTNTVAVAETVPNPESPSEPELAAQQAKEEAERAQRQAEEARLHAEAAAKAEKLRADDAREAAQRAKERDEAARRQSEAEDRATAERAERLRATEAKAKAEALADMERRSKARAKRKAERVADAKRKAERDAAIAAAAAAADAAKAQQLEDATPDDAPSDAKASGSVPPSFRSKPRREPTNVDPVEDAADKAVDGVAETSPTGKNETVNNKLVKRAASNKPATTYTVAPVVVPEPMPVRRSKRKRKVNEDREVLPSVRDADNDILLRVNRARRRQMQRRLAAAAVAAFVALFALVTLGGDDPPPTEESPLAADPVVDRTPADPIRAGAMARTLLADIVVAEPQTSAPFVGDWDLLDTDRDGDCLSVRTDALRAASQQQIAANQGCRISQGQWTDQLSGLPVDTASALSAELLVTPLDAHQSGAWKWSVSQRDAFASDLGEPASFLFRDSSTNPDRTGGPATFRPESEELWCWYATDWIRVKWRWGLTATSEEVAALRSMLDTCSSASAALPANRAFPPVRVQG